MTWEPMPSSPSPGSHVHTTHSATHAPGRLQTPAPEREGRLGREPPARSSRIWCLWGAGQTSRDVHLAGETKALEKTAWAVAAGGVALLQREDTGLSV